jgi:uncharacterized membrane protein
MTKGDVAGVKMVTGLSTLKSYGMRVRRRFSMSFWCALYNMFLFMMLLASVVFHFGVLSIMKLVARLTGRWSEPELDEHAGDAAELHASNLGYLDATGGHGKTSGAA